MDLVELLEKDKKEYNHFVANAKSGSFLQSYDWGQWQVRLGREVYRYWIVDNEKKQIGTIQLIKTPLPLGKFYLYAPYGPVGPENYELGIKNYEWVAETLKSKFSNCLFIRIEPKNLELATSHSQLATKTANIQPGKTLVIDLSQTAEELLQQMHPKTRYNIRLAEKHGVEIKDEFDISIGHGLFAQEAAELVVKTATRQGYKGYSNNYYQQLIDCFAVQNRGDVRLRIYKAIYQNKLLSSAIMVDYGSTRTFLFGGSAEENKNVMAPYLMHWQAMQDAKLAGLKHYDFWGTETSAGKPAGFVRFKLGFGGTEIQYAGAYDLVLKPVWYKIYKAFRKLVRIIK